MNKTVLITGASSGFGNLTAKKFQSEGWNVVATMRSPKKEQELNYLENVLVTKLDVTDKASIGNAVSETIEKFGTIDVLVNNAGFGGNGYLEQIPVEQIARMFDTNVFGAIRVSQAVLPMMRERKSGFEAVWHMMRMCYPILKENGGGRIINISSGAASVGAPGFGVYAGVKAGVHGLTMVAAREWGSDKITVNSLAPVFYSDLSNRLFDKGGEQGLTDLTPLGYIGDAEKDIAPVVVFMASEDARYITGQMIKVDGGSDIHF